MARTAIELRGAERGTFQKDLWTPLREILRNRATVLASSLAATTGILVTVPHAPRTTHILPAHCQE